MSAFKSGVKPEVNNRNQALLRGLIEDSGYSYIKVDGHYTYTDPDKKQSVDAMERTTFIIGVPFDLVKKWAERFDQETFIWGADGEIGLFNGDGSKQRDFSEVHADPLRLEEKLEHLKEHSLEEAFSSYKSRVFKLGHFYYRPHGYFSAMGWYSELKKRLVACLGSEDAVDHELDDLTLAMKIAEKAGV
jgi:hypothetical protein